MKWPLVSRRRFEALQACLTESHLRAAAMEELAEAWKETALDGEARFDLMREDAEKSRMLRLRAEGEIAYRDEKVRRAIGLLVPPEGKKSA